MSAVHWQITRLILFPSGSDSKVSDVDGQPYTTLLYSNGPGYTQPRSILREAGKDSIQVRAASILISARIGGSSPVFIGSENDRVARSRPRSKIHHVPSLFQLREIFDQTLPTAYCHAFPRSFRNTSLDTDNRGFLIPTVEIMRYSLAEFFGRYDDR